MESIKSSRVRSPRTDGDLGRDNVIVVGFVGTSKDAWVFKKKKLREKPWSWLLFVHVCLTFLYQMGKKLIFFSCDVAEQVHRMIRGGGGVL